jgi:hypothetical protein
MFEKSERQVCAVCGVALVAFEKLPPSHDALSEDGVPRQPEWERVPITYLRRGRGALTALAVAGLGAFFLPWVRETMPDIVTYSGWGLARQVVWAWAAGVAWFVLVPTVLSRRTVMHMRGARVAAAFLSALPGVTAGIFLVERLHGSHGVPLKYTYGPGIYATLALSLAAIAVSLFFGGRLDDLVVQRGTSAGQVVH